MEKDKTEETPEETPEDESTENSSYPTDPTADNAGSNLVTEVGDPETTEPE